MTQQQSEILVNLLKNKSIEFEVGLNDAEINMISNIFEINFPIDLKTFLKTAMPISKGFVNWRLGLKDKEEEKSINERLAWPLEGMKFDIEFNKFWDENWGIKPSKLEESFLIAELMYRNFPKLIPIYSHRYISSTPNRVGNPVYSIYQMDMIYYGFDLANYFANEFEIVLPNRNFENILLPKLDIEFWSEWVG